MLVGVDDDSLKWDRPQETVSIARDLGLKAFRITVAWRSGQSRLTGRERRLLDSAVAATWGLRLVVAVYGPPDEAPQDSFERAQYCGYVAELLRTYPTVNDVVIWNEPNVSRFWRPQFDADGASAAPEAYEALLARCWDTLHAARSSVNVIAATSPRGNDNPLATSNVSHSPVTWYREVGAAYRASGRGAPILDTIGHNPYPATTSEPPWAEHPDSSSVGQGDYGKLIAVLEDAFGDTAQPLPGREGVTIWYMEQGFQSTIEFDKAGLYTGSETDGDALPPWSPDAAAAESDGPAPDQATQLADAVRFAYCQPYVGAFFNFELADEPSLLGWQSGVLWVDKTPKPSYYAFKRAVADVNAGSVDCAAFPSPGAHSASTQPIRFNAPPKVPEKPTPKIPVVIVG